MPVRCNGNSSPPAGAWAPAAALPRRLLDRALQQKKKNNLSDNLKSIIYFMKTMTSLITYNTMTYSDVF